MFLVFLLALSPLVAPAQAAAKVSLENSQPVLNKLVTADFSIYKPQIEAFYRTTNYAVVWTHSGLVTRQAKAIIDNLSHADRKGLNPDDYDGSRWANRLALLDQSSSSKSAAELARFDLELTISVMRYISDLHFGRANPGLLHSKADLDPLDVGSFVRQRLVDAVDVNSVIDGVEPQYKSYRRTQEALRKYLALSRMDDCRPLPAVERTIGPGQNYAAASGLARKLLLIGDLPPEAMPPIETSTYSDSLAKAVRHFQVRHGLKSDGRLDNGTIAQLNVPFSRRVLQLQLALERWRWIPHSFSGPLIVVNIPEFKLRAFDHNDDVSLEMEIVVGAAAHHQTPVFVGNLSSVIFRPYWNVPRSIEQAELLPKLERDRSYLARFGYQVVTSHGTALTIGNRIEDATLAQLRSGAFHIRQIPGTKNALGLIKFVFPNEYNIYMHGTPEMELFSKSRRDFSHGCIRLSKPAELAVWVLRSQPGWTLPRIFDVMSGTTTIPVTLNHSIPVLIMYTTAIVLENGEEHFLEDIYGQDVRLGRILSRGYAGRGSISKGATHVN